MDSLIFVDDSRFEREEVRAACPDVMTLDASNCPSILERPDCDLPITDDSRNRRRMYRVQLVRDGAHQGYGGDYIAFLRNCNFGVTIAPLTELNLERVHELTQRTNQMNFSGNRYSRSQLHSICNNSELDTYVLDCADRFGSYGTVGFGLVNRHEPRLLDLMFSCRIQGKRVEHAFVAYLVSKYRQGRSRPFFVDYRETKRNAEAGKVFRELGAQLVTQSDGVSKLVFPAEYVVADDGIVKIVDRGGPAAEECEQHV
jgi:FkbH-like protein